MQAPCYGDPVQSCQNRQDCSSRYTIMATLAKQADGNNEIMLVAEGATGSSLARRSMRGALILSSSAAVAPDGDIRESLGDGLVSSSAVGRRKGKQVGGQFL